MSATIHTKPLGLALSKDAIYMTVASDKIDIAERAIVSLTLSGAGPSDGQTINIQYLGKNLTFTAKAAPGTNGKEFGLKGALSDPAYLAAVADSFKENQTLSADFDITVVGNDLILTYKDASPLTIAINNALSNFGTSGLFEVTTTGPWLEPNLACVARVEDATTGAILSTFEVPYSTLTGKAVFDLRSALRNLTPQLPNMVDRFGAVTTALQAYKVRIADKYGDEPEAEALKYVKTGASVDIFRAIYGASRGNSLGTWYTNDGKSKVLHNTPLKQTVTLKQPQFLYVYFINDTTGAIFMTVTAVDISGATHALSYGTVDINPVSATGKLAWYATDYDTLEIAAKYDAAGGVLPLYSYIFHIKNDLGDTLAQCEYVIDNDCSSSTQYVLCENGCGGMETVAFTGDCIFEYTSERATAEIVRWTDFTTALGDIESYDEKGQITMRMSTKLLDLPSLYRMRQLLLGKTWLVDTANNRFLRIIADTKSISMPTIGQNTGFLAMTFKAAWYDASFNEF